MELINSILNTPKISNEVSLDTQSCIEDNGFLDIFLKNLNSGKQISLEDLNLDFTPESFKKKNESLTDKDLAESLLSYISYINLTSSYIYTPDDRVQIQSIDQPIIKGLDEFLSFITNSIRPGDEIVLKVGEKEIKISKDFKNYMSISIKESIDESHSEVFSTEILNGANQKPLRESIEMVGAVRRDNLDVTRDTVRDEGIEEKITDNRVRLDSKEGVIHVTRDIANDRGIEEKIIRFRNPVDEEGIVSQVKQTKTDSLKLEELSSENVEGESKKVNKVDKDFKGEADYDSILMRLQTQTIVNKHPEKEQVSKFFEKLDNLISERIVKGDDKGEAILNLHPDIIGEVRIRVFLDGDRLSIRLLVSNEEARSFISDGLDTLRENLSQKGFNLGNVNVYIMGQDMGTSYGRNNHGSFIFSPFIEKEKDTIDIVDIVNTSSKIDLIV